MKTIVLVGIPGAGKSSILKEVCQLCNVVVVNYGDKMMEEAASENITRDTLRKMPFREQQKIGVKAARKIIQEYSDNVVIIDTHALIKTNIGYCPGLPLEVLQILSPTAYALVECRSDIILERRSKDPIRTRDKESVEELVMHQELTRSFITACSMQTSSLLCCIQNNNLEISQNIIPLVQLIHSLK